jgi:hypothetical protein
MDYRDNRPATRKGGPYCTPIWGPGSTPIYSLPAIMQAYRWRDPKTVMRYGAKLAAKSGASARMAARFVET